MSTHTHTRLHAVCVSNSADYFYDVLDDLLGEYGLTDKDGKPLRARDLAHLTDDYKGIGYALSTEEELGTYMCISMLYTSLCVCIFNMLHTTGRYTGQLMIHVLRERPIYRPIRMTSCAQICACYCAYAHCAIVHVQNNSM